MANDPGAPINVQVCYALPTGQTLIDVAMPAGSTLAEAIAASGILAIHPEIDMARQRLGVFGRLCGAETPLVAGDRVEIYRPLALDPKLARQRRVAEVRAAGSREGRRWTHKDSR